MPRLLAGTARGPWGSGTATVAWYGEEDADVARALGAGRAAHASTRAATPAIAYAASLQGDARVLGRYRRERWRAHQSWM